MHITQIPYVHEQIINGAFQLFDCKKCKNHFVNERTSVYTDIDRGYYLAIESFGTPKKSNFWTTQKKF